MIALHIAKLIFKSPLHLLYCTKKIHTMATLLYHFDRSQLSLAEMYSRSITAMHATSNFKAHLNALILATYRCY